MKTESDSSDELESASDLLPSSNSQKKVEAFTISDENSNSSDIPLAKLFAKKANGGAINDCKLPVENEAHNLKECPRVTECQSDSDTATDSTLLLSASEIAKSTQASKTKLKRKRSNSSDVDGHLKKPKADIVEIDSDTETENTNTNNLDGRNSTASSSSSGEDLPLIKLVNKPGPASSKKNIGGLLIDSNQKVKVRNDKRLNESDISHKLQCSGNSGSSENDSSSSDSAADESSEEEEKPFSSSSGSKKMLLKKVTSKDSSNPPLSKKNKALEEIVKSNNKGAREQETSSSDSEDTEKSRLVNEVKKSDKKKVQDVESSISDGENVKDKKSGTKKKVNEVDKAKKRPGDNPRIIRLQRYLKEAGIRVQNYKTLWEGCKSDKARGDKLIQLLQERGLKGKPSISECRRLKKKHERKKEIAELNTSNIISSSGRSRRCTSSLYASSLRSPSPNNTQQNRPTPSKSPPEFKKAFSRLKNIVDSEDSD